MWNVSAVNVSVRARLKLGWLSYHSWTYGGALGPAIRNWILTGRPFGASTA